MSRLPELAQLARLFTIKNQAPLSLADICRRVECSERSAKRYIAELRDTFGYPIEYDRDHGGYRLNGDPDDHGYVLPGLFFRESELSALMTMRELLASLQPGIFEKDLAPLGRRVERLLAETGVTPAETARRIRIVSMASRQAPDGVFRNCSAATLSRRRMMIEYQARGSNPGVTEREVSPQRLVHYRESWYLDAWCHLRQGIRVFALEQIASARILDGAAIEVPEEDLEREVRSAYGIFTGEPTDEAVLRFSAHRAQWVSKEVWHGKQASRWLEDGRYELKVPYRWTEELLMDILKYGPDCEVVAPPQLRTAVADASRRLASMYGDASA